MGFNVRSCLLGMSDTQVEVGGAREPANRILRRLPGYPGTHDPRQPDHRAHRSCGDAVYKFARGITSKAMHIRSSSELKGMVL